MDIFSIYELKSYIYNGIFKNIYGQITVIYALKNPYMNILVIYELKSYIYDGFFQNIYGQGTVIYALKNPYMDILVIYVLKSYIYVVIVKSYMVKVLSYML